MRPSYAVLIWILPMLLLGLSPTVALAHGAHITTTTTNTIVVALHATYDSGEPMAGGQVSVYAPNDLSTPWQTGVCDSDGQYTFVPDTSITGVWEVQVRQAGHGDLAYITIAAPADGGGDGEHTASAPIVLQQQPGYTPLQIALMSGCVVWGFVGTALFFQRSKKG